MGLRQKRSMGQPLVVVRAIDAAQHAELEFPQLLQVAEQLAFEFGKTVGVGGDLFHLLERPFQLAVVDRLPQRSRSAEVSVGQPVDVAVRR
jgi:hypothetical protein